jgi:predicted flap endonuclease-1-like 5' DNA nuclease
MKSKSEFDPMEWAKKENAPQKSTVTNPNPAASQSDWSPTDDYEQAREVVKRLVRSGTCISDDYNDWFRIGSALANGLGEAGRDLYHQLSCMSSKYDYAECDKKYDNCLRTSNGSITLATFFQMAKDAGVDIRTMPLEAGKVAKVAMSHTYTETAQKDNSLIINKDIKEKILTDACDIATTATNRFSTFSDKIDPEDWCGFLQPVQGWMNDAQSKDKMTLSVINTISGAIPNYYAIYDERVIYPPLYFLFCGKAASRKGEIGLALKVLKALKREIQKAYHAEKEAYEQEHASWEAKNSKAERAERGPEPKEPKYRSPIMAANSSYAVFISDLKANDGWGVMFDTEADNVSQMLKTDYGDYSTLLRQAPHHEPICYNRVRDNIHIEIEEPRLAVCLTCTPDQLPALFPTILNGLGSRFLFYNLNREVKWRSPFQRKEKTNEQLFEELGERYLELHHMMQELGDRRIQFIMPESLQEHFNQYFEEMLQDQFYMLGDGIVSFIFRMGLYFIRITMVLALLRRFSDLAPGKPLFEAHEQAITCSETDFRIAMTIMDTLVNHTAYIYSGLGGEKEEDIFDHPVNLSPEELRLFKALPDEYKTGEAKKRAEEIGMNPATAKRYIGDFWKKHRIVERSSHGHYVKKNLRK